MQVHGSLISSDGGADVEALAINAASAALATSDIPWAGTSRPCWHTCFGTPASQNPGPETSPAISLIFIFYLLYFTSFCFFFFFWGCPTAFWTRSVSLQGP